MSYCIFKIKNKKNNPHIKGKVFLDNNRLPYLINGFQGYDSFRNGVIGLLEQGKKDFILNSFKKNINLSKTNLDTISLQGRPEDMIEILTIIAISKGVISINEVKEILSD